MEINLMERVSDKGAQVVARKKYFLGSFFFYYAPSLFSIAIPIRVVSPLEWIVLVVVGGRWRWPLVLAKLDDQPDTAAAIHY